ncbi:MAG: nitrate reductase associated protein [Polyangiales bacterium]
MWAFEGHGLEYMPLDVRRKLDLAGLRPTLVEWQSLTLEQRAALDAAPLEGFADQVIALLPDVARTPPSTRPWNGARDAITAHAKSMGLALEGWESLDDAQRYALFRLAQPEKDREKFRAALAEFTKR